MSIFFPEPQTVKLRSDLELNVFQCREIVVLLAEILPGAIFEPHQHPESQMGIIFSGSVEINVNGKKTILEPFEQVYVAGTNIPHGSTMLSQETVLGLELKYLLGSHVDERLDEPILNLQPAIDETTGFLGKFAANSWFQIAILEIPANEQLPRCTTTAEEIGMTLNEPIVMKVGEEEKLLEYGSIYYAPAGVARSGYNTSDKTISLIKISLCKNSSGNHQPTRSFQTRN